jgi:hypothetical protein
VGGGSRNVAFEVAFNGGEMCSDTGCCPRYYTNRYRGDPALRGQGSCWGRGDFKWTGVMNQLTAAGVRPYWL